ncbi:MAG TPA: hypothetical protein VFZ61_09405 [Polyangiales bacterium]
MATVGKLSVIVAQYGADVSVCSTAASAADGACEILQQRSDESPTQLTSRVRARLADLSRTGYRIHHARFIARKGFDVRDVMAAAGLLRGLVSAMVAAGTAHVHLHAEPSDLQTRYAITALAEAMADQLHGTGVDFNTHLTGPAQPTTARKPEAVGAPTSSLPR